MQLDSDLDIDPRNAPVLALPESHPARQCVIAQAICRRDCACREIPWPDPEWIPVDQEWTSQVDGRNWKFSGVIYGFVSFTLVLDGWIEHPTHLSGDEIEGLDRIPRVLALLSECESAALIQANQEIIQMIAIARAFFTLWDQAIHLRIQQDQIKVGSA